MIYNYVEIELSEKEKYDILRKEIVDYLITKQYLIFNDDTTQQSTHFKKEKKKEKKKIMNYW